jgi:hypothetical protein
MNYFAYTRNDGTTVVAIKTAQDIANTAGLGFTRNVGNLGVPDAAHPAPPKGFRARRVYLLDPATQRKRTEVVATPAAFATLTGTGGQTVTLDEITGGTTTWNVTGGRDEKVTSPHIIH